MRMIIRVPGPVPNWNLYINDERRNRYAAAKEKRDEKIRAKAAAHGKKWSGRYPLSITVISHFQNKRRDLDNVRIKGLIDGFVAAGVIRNDNLTYIREYQFLSVVDDWEGMEFVLEEWKEAGNGEGKTRSAGNP